MSVKGKGSMVDYLHKRELRKAEYLYEKKLRASSPMEAARYDKELQRLLKSARLRERQGGDRMNRKIKIKTPKGTMEYRNKYVENTAKHFSEDL